MSLRAISPQIAPDLVVDTDDSFSNVSPQFAAAFRFRPGQSAYGSFARGFKAGGFNPASPAGSEAYGKEHTWNLEGGIKASTLAILNKYTPAQPPRALRSFSRQDSVTCGPCLGVRSVS